MISVHRISKHFIPLALALMAIGPSATAARRPQLTEAFPALSFEQPLDFQSSPAFPDRVFIVEQGGSIWSVSLSQPGTRSLVVDLSGLVSRDGGERGLLGMAFHPNAAANGYFYVNYTRSSDGATVISRFTITPGSTTATTSSEVILLVVDQPFSNHNGGSLAFGRDGFLYIPLGDGGSGGDPQGNGQNLSALLGKILRIDVDSSAGGLQYAIPASNPYAGNSKGYRPEIFASGVRNPFKITFDSGTGKLWAADVGQNRLEEIDIIRRGKNYGWNRMEGNLCYPSGKPCKLKGLTLPIYTYGRNLGQSITGGYVYRGTSIKSLVGQYVYADFVTGRVWKLKYQNGRATNRLIADTDYNVSSFGVDQSKNLYLVSYDGRIFRFT